MANTAHNRNFSTEDWQVSVVNNTAGVIASGRDVKVMIYQALSDCNAGKGFSSPWFVVDIPSPGRVGPIRFPKEVHFGALDSPDGIIPRLTGPVGVEYGQNINIVQHDPQNPPEIQIGVSQADNEITATSLSGNVKPLELALYKSERKLVSYKQVNPNEEVRFSLEPALYIVEVKSIGGGSDFEASSQESTKRATKIVLSEDKVDIKIEITKRLTGQLDFSEIPWNYNWTLDNINRLI